MCCAMANASRARDLSVAAPASTPHLLALPCICIQCRRCRPVHHVCSPLRLPLVGRSSKRRHGRYIVPAPVLQVTCLCFAGCCRFDPFACALTGSQDIMRRCAADAVCTARNCMCSVARAGASDALAFLRGCSGTHSLTRSSRSCARFMRLPKFKRPIVQLHPPPLHLPPPPCSTSPTATFPLKITWQQTGSGQQNFAACV